MLKIEQAQKVVDILFRTELKFGEMKSLFEKEFDEETLFHIYFQLSVLFTNHVLGHDQQVQTFYLLLNSEKDLALEENPFYPLFLFIYETRLDFPNEYQPQLLEVISALLAQENIPDFSDFNLEEFSLFRIDFCERKIRILRLQF